jgi:transposase
MFFELSNARVYLALGNTDMRKAINGLSILVEQRLDLDPFSGHLFVFCNRKRTIVKTLYWDRNGFCLWQKRLEKHRFKWPESTEQLRKVGLRELRWLLDGLEIHPQTAHEKLTYTAVY